MGGDLTLDEPAIGGATFTLHLPASDEVVPVVTSHEIVPGHRAQAHSPRARLLVDMATALSEQSLDRVVGGIQKIYSELLGATGGMLLVPRKDGSFHPAGAYGEGEDVAAGSSVELENLMSGVGSLRVDHISSISWLSETNLGGSAAMLLPVHDADRVVAVLAVGWKSADAIPTGAAVSVAKALADLTASAIARTALARDVVFERTLRASVMDELPIAVSIFVGDPPQVIDWNRKERELLGIDDDSLRPQDLSASQQLFDVRFADGTPLTVHNAPVTSAVRTGKAAGPFILLIRRVDGTQVHTRTYCAPFFDNDGSVAGAVVTSEALDIAVSPQIDSPASLT
jgi:PAS domain-containing protein